MHRLLCGKYGWILAVAGWVCLGHGAVAGAAVFPDKNLELAVRDVLYDKHDLSQSLTDADLKNVYVLEAQYRGIKDLTGLEKCTNLQLLDLADNEVSSLAALQGLSHLQSLDLGKNKISDLKPLAKINRLSLLRLSDNEIVEIGPISAQTQLSMLFLERNKISDLGALVKAVQADAVGAKRFASFLRLYIAGNPLADPAQAEQLNQLKQAGVRVEG